MQYYGQAEINTAADGRGVVPSNFAQQVRAARAAEWWERYDAIVIGPGARELSRGWFNSWTQLAAADRVTFFSGRDSSVGPAYSNQPSERTDWAQDLYHTHVEMISPVGAAEIQTINLDAQTIPLMFAHDLANQLVLTTQLAESDEIAQAPASHYPAGYGVAYGQNAGAASPITIPGTNGEPFIGNGWKWPEPIMLAAKAKLTVRGAIDDPLKTALRTLPGPGFRRVPNGDGTFTDIPNYYVIRMTFAGPRYLQLRGGRSSS